MDQPTYTGYDVGLVDNPDGTATITCFPSNNPRCIVVRTPKTDMTGGSISPPEGSDFQASDQASKRAPGRHRPLRPDTSLERHRSSGSFENRVTNKEHRRHPDNSPRRDTRTLTVRECSLKLRSLKRAAGLQVGRNNAALTSRYRCQSICRHDRPQVNTRPCARTMRRQAGE